jgi:tricorn protease
MKPGRGLFLLAVFLIPQWLLAGEVKLLREPDLSGDTLVFSYARDIWRASVSGGEATRITSFQGQEMHPRISPDGQWVAFTGEYDGNEDVYITPITGGEPKRLTFHPGADIVMGWTPDGRSVLFSSGRNNAPRAWAQLFTISVDGGMPVQLPMNRAFEGAFAADGNKLVFRRPGLWDEGFRNYRGGQNQALRLIDLKDLSERDLPWDNSLDLQPAWQGEYIYYLSNRSQVANIFRVSEKGGAVEQLTDYRDFDVKGFTIDGDQLVYEYQGGLYRRALDGEASPIHITLNADFPWDRPHWEDVSKLIESANFSPSGKRAVFVARGDVFTVPVEHGDARNLTDSSGSREVAAAWSADGQRIAWFSDASGEYRLVISDQFGKQQQQITLAESGFYGELQWSPDDQHLVFSDQKQRLWIADVKAGSAKPFAEQPVVDPDWTMAPSWSPDSRYIAYSLEGDNFFRSLMIYSVKDGKATRITDGMADVRFPVWDKSGDKLYFAVSTDFGPVSAWLDLSALAFTPHYNIYYLLLNEEATSPFLPKSDEEEVVATDTDDKENKDGKDDAKPAAPQVKLALGNTTGRILPLGEAGRITELRTGKAGELFYLKTQDEKAGLYKYSLEKLEAVELAPDVADYRVSADGEKILVKSGANWQVFSSAAPLGEDAKTLKVSLSKFVDNSAEWQQIFREAWRFQRDYFYVSNLHGADWNAVYEAYQPLVSHVKHAADMTYLLDNLGAETSIGHSFTSDGDLPDIGEGKIGLLGADLEATDKGFQFKRIYGGESWYPSDQTSAPLGKLTGQIKAGDYLAAINGKPLEKDGNLFQALGGTLGNQTRLTVHRDGRKSGDSEVVVVPIENDRDLRRNAWVESNRERVDKASGGKLAYVWVPDTAEGGFAYFNRYFFAQSQKQGVVVDERFNHGGLIANYVIDILRRERNGYFNNQLRPDHPMSSPGAGIWGPKVMLINEVSGSGGDMLPHMFKFYEIGTLVGKRTWGGLVGIWGVPGLVDGGYITAPRSGYFNMQGQWDVENQGVSPDIDVEQWTRETSKGLDPQLEMAIKVAMDQLQSHPVENKTQPADPVRVPQVPQK